MYALEQVGPPPTRKRIGLERRYPFEAMKVGESFVVLDRTRATVAGSAAYWQKRLKRKFVVRSLGPDGVRVWRVK